MIDESESRMQLRALKTRNTVNEYKDVKNSN